MYCIDSFPLLPRQYTSDSVGPKLERWFINRDTYASLFLFFDEPVRSRVNASYSISFASQLNTAYSLFVSSIDYKNLNTEVTIGFGSSCYPSNATCTSRLPSILQRSIETLYLNIASDSLIDFALIPNGNVAIGGNTALKQGDPGRELRVSMFHQ